MNKKAWKLVPEELVTIVIQSGIFIVVLIAVAGIYSVFKDTPDKIQEVNMKRLGNTAKELIKNLPEESSIESYIIVPFQFSDKFALQALNADPKCHKNDCICLSKKEDESSKYFCQEFEKTSIERMSFAPQNNLLINLVVAARKDASTTHLKFIASEIDKPLPSEYFSADEQNIENVISNEGSKQDQSAQQSDIKETEEETQPSQTAVKKGTADGPDLLTDKVKIKSSSQLGQYSPFIGQQFASKGAFAEQRIYGGKTLSHGGFDFSSPMGTKVYAVADGVVKSVLEDKSGYGKYIIIAHEKNIQTLYAHLSSPKVIQGQAVKKGELIALSGNSGNGVTHLHFEVRDNKGTLVNGQKVSYNAINPLRLKDIFG